MENESTVGRTSSDESSDDDEGSDSNTGTKQAPIEIDDEDEDSLADNHGGDEQHGLADEDELGLGFLSAHNDDDDNDDDDDDDDGDISNDDSEWATCDGDDCNMRGYFATKCYCEGFFFNTK